MSASTVLTTAIQIRRSRLLGLIGAVAGLTAVVTWLLVSVAFDRSTSTAADAQPKVALEASSAADDARRVPSIMSLTPARLAAGALGTGYALPSEEAGPTVESVLASMSPGTRRSTTAIMNLTFAQLAAGAAGHP
jgi:hypothetical protein